MKSIECTSITVSVYICGDIETIRKSVRKYCLGEGACVTVAECDYIYTGGAERGVEITFRNYPRFPLTEEKIISKAIALGSQLLEDCSQGSFMVQAPNKTVWYSRRDEIAQQNNEVEREAQETRAKDGRHIR